MRQQIIAVTCALLALQLGCGRAAEKLGSKATQGALEGVAEATEKNAAAEDAPERLTGDVVAGSLEQLSQPEQLRQVGLIAGTAMSEALETLLRTRGVEEGSGTGGSGFIEGQALLDAMAQEAAQTFTAAFSRELSRQLGANGEGPLSQALAATTERVSASAVRGAAEEVRWLPLAAAFGVGLIAALLLVLVGASLRSLRASPPSARRAG